MEYNEQQEFINIVKKIFINVNILKRDPNNYSDEILLYKDYKNKYGNDPIFKTTMNSAFSDLSKRIPSEKEKNDYIEAAKKLYIELTVLKKNRLDYANEIDIYRTFRRFYLSPIELKQITDYSILQAKIWLARSNEILRQQQQPVTNVTDSSRAVLPNVVYNKPVTTTLVTQPPPPATNVTQAVVTQPPPQVSNVTSTIVIQPPPPVSNVTSTVVTQPPPQVTNVTSTIVTQPPPPVTNVTQAVVTQPPPPVSNVTQAVVTQPPPPVSNVTPSAVSQPPVTNVTSTVVTQPPSPVTNATSSVVEPPPQATNVVTSLPNVVYSQEPPSNITMSQQIQPEILDISSQQIDSIISKIYSSQAESQKELNVDILPSLQQIGDDNYSILQKALLKDKVLKYERMKKFPEITSKDEEIIEYNRTHFFQDTLNYLRNNNISTDKYVRVMNFSEYKSNEISANSSVIDTLSKNIDPNTLKQIQQLSDSDYLVYIIKDRKNVINNSDLTRLIDNELLNVSQKNSFSNQQMEIIKKRADNIIEGYKYIYNRFVGIY